MALNAVGVVASSLHARRTQAQRSEALGALRAGHVSAMCATDVAARGLDIPALALVVHYDAALAPDDYVHRTGRTARAGRSGVALSLVCEADVDRVRAIEAATGTELSRWQEDEDDVLRHLKDSLSAWRVAGVVRLCFADLLLCCFSLFLSLFLSFFFSLIMVFLSSVSSILKTCNM